MQWKAIGFDVDGTLYPNATMYRRSLWWGLKNFNFLKAFNQTRIELRKQDSVEDFYRQQAEVLASKLDIEFLDAKNKIETIVYTNWENILRGIPLFHGVRDCIETIRSRGIKTGVLSDFPVRNKLKLLGVDDLFDCAICSEECGQLKPGKKAFLMLAESLSCKPEEVLYVGNSWHYDIEGASELGMGLAYLGQKKHKSPQIDLQFRSYDVFKAFVLKNF